MSTALIAVSLIVAIAYMMGTLPYGPWNSRSYVIGIACLLLLLVLCSVLMLHERQSKCEPVPGDNKPSLKKGVHA